MLSKSNQRREKCFDRSEKRHRWNVIAIQEYKQLISARKREKEMRTISIRLHHWMSTGNQEGEEDGSGRRRGEIGKREQALSPFAAFHSNPSALSSRGFFALYPQISHRRVTVRFRLALFHGSCRTLRLSSPLHLIPSLHARVCT